VIANRRTFVVKRGCQQALVAMMIEEAKIALSLVFLRRAPGNALRDWSAGVSLGSTIRDKSRRPGGQTVIHYRQINRRNDHVPESHTRR